MEIEIVLIYFCLCKPQILNTKNDLYFFPSHSASHYLLSAMYRKSKDLSNFFVIYKMSFSLVSMFTCTSQAVYYHGSPILTTRCEDSRQVKMNIMVMISHCKIPHLGNNKMFCPSNKCESSILVSGESVILCSVQSSVWIFCLDSCEQR